MPRALAAALAVAAALGCAACFAPLKNLPERSALEQQLVSAALRRSLAKLDLRELEHGRPHALRVYAPAGSDVDLIRALVEERLAREGLSFEGSPPAGAPELRALVPFAGADLESRLLGVPFLVPGLPVALGDISVYRSSELTGRARVELSLWEDGRFRPIAASEASRYYQDFSVLTFIGPFRTTDLDEGAAPGEEEDAPGS